MKDHVHESHFIDMDDATLKEALGYLWEGSKRLTELMKADPKVEAMLAELKAYKESHYTTEIKRLAKMLKAARVVAKMRNINWRAPE